MTAKDWLQRGWQINREIDTLTSARRTVWDRLTRISSDPGTDYSGRGPDLHRMDSAGELFELIDSKCEELTAVSAEIIKAISRVEDRTQRTLLVKRYIEFKTWEQIAVDLGYTWRHVHRIHAEALKAVEKILSLNVT